jgi:hypothetical protein
MGDAALRVRQNWPSDCDLLHYRPRCLVDNVPGLKAQDDGQATKTHAEVGRSDDLCGISDHHRVRGVDGNRGGIRAYARDGVPAVTQRGPWIRFGGWPLPPPTSLADNARQRVSVPFLPTQLGGIECWDTRP